MGSYKTNLSQKLRTDAGTLCDRAFIAHFQVSAANAVASDTDGVHASVNGAVQELTTEITNPAVPRNITATAGGTAGSIKAIQVVIEGTNYADEVITETLPAFTVDTAGTVEGNKAFKTVTKITIPAHDATSATTIIGFGDKLGLPYLLGHNTVLNAYLNNVKESTAPTVTVSATALCNNTIKLNSALAGTVVDAYLMV
jgi:hypothetical protein